MLAERKRPWYLALALLGALALGTVRACTGWSAAGFYQRGPADPPLATLGLPDPIDQADRAAIQSRFEAYLHTADAAKSRGWPLAVAALVLGSALVVFSMRALGGSPGARVALVQLVVAQAGLSGLEYWLMRDVRDAGLQCLEAKRAAELHEGLVDSAYPDDRLLTVTDVLASVLVVVALTRQRARDFFDASAAAVQGR